MQKCTQTIVMCSQVRGASLACHVACCPAASCNPDSEMLFISWHDVLQGGNFHAMASSVCFLVPFVRQLWWAMGIRCASLYCQEPMEQAAC